MRMEQLGRKCSQRNLSKILMPENTLLDPEKQKIETMNTVEPETDKNKKEKITLSKTLD